MDKRFQIRFTIIFALCLFGAITSFAQADIRDSVPLNKLYKQQQFYDSLEFRAGKRKFTGWLYDLLISSPAPQLDEREIALEYFRSFEGMIIARIDYKRLDVFGPTLLDTSRTADKWIEKAANSIHSKSSLKTIRKQLLFKTGDILDPKLMAENERIIRQVPYLKDVRFLIKPDSLYPAFVNVLVLTKDRFSFGISGGIGGTKTGELEFYDKNVLGIGHEISVRFVGKVDENPKMGIETFYRINNIGGRFINIDLGYLNTYLRKGYVFNLEKPFISNEIKWGYGAANARLFRTTRVTENHPIELDPPISESYNILWIGRNFDLESRNGFTCQLTPTLGMYNLNFFDVNEVSEGNEEFFANRTLYMAGLSFSQRKYVQDKLIYSYGIIEDIPAGFKQELMYGYDANEFGDRHFIQMFSSNGIILSRKGYLFVSAGANSYLKEGRFEEGLLRANMNFFTRLKSTGTKVVRSFIKLDYTIGIRRYPSEYLTLGTDNHIRGFNSENANGQQRLALNMEHVVFFPQEFYGFKMALFTFADLGVVGSGEHVIFKKDYYAGLGLGVRLHNENLVFDTFRLRLAFYPFHPKDMGFVGFIFDEQSKTHFTSLEPTAPQPAQFK